LTLSPQASVTLPQVTPLAAQRFASLRTGVHVPWAHSSPVWQVPQSSTPPHPSLMAPQVMFDGQAVILLQAPHWKVSASQTSPPPQPPQFRVPPQPSLGLPHWIPRDWHVPAVQAVHVCVF
jgi:hypothetical protein